MKKKTKERTWKETLRRLILDLSMILTANDWPETVSVASLTLAELPSPRVLPSSYFPTRIPFLTIQESMIRSLDWANEAEIELWIYVCGSVYVYIEEWDWGKEEEMAAEYLREEHATFLLLPRSPFFSGNYSIGSYSLFSS